MHLGLALFVVPSYGVAPAIPVDGDNCTSFGRVPWSKGRTYGCTTKTSAQPATVEPSSALTATTIALAATALPKPAAAESSTSLYPMAKSHLDCQARCREPSSLPHDTRTCSSARCSGRAASLGLSKLFEYRNA